MGMRLLRLCVAEGLQQCITSSIVPRPSHGQLFDHLQHREGLGDFHDCYELLTGAKGSGDLKVYLVASVCCWCYCSG